MRVRRASSRPAASLCSAFGGQHALIHPAIPMIANLGYLVDGSVYHPGDSFTVPTAPVSTLLLP